MQKLIKFLITAYLKIVNLFRKITYPKKSRAYFDLSERDFNDLINSYEYKYDPIHGLIDYIDTPDNFFDPDKKEGRDCDDFQRMWSLWGTYHGYIAKEYIICNGSSIGKAFRTMHAIGILKDKTAERYLLTNYHTYGPFSTEANALGYMDMWDSYKDNAIIVFSREIPPES